MSHEHDHLPKVSPSDVFNADVDYLLDTFSDQDLAHSLHELEQTNVHLYRRLLRHADSESHGDAQEQHRLLKFALFTLGIIERTIERGDSRED